ncbi:MAG: PQQ-binding-like beta-propeller repeat protein [Victivallales bacterium]|nr:PQQ-binding-like beta-propeller repeat protein [Victivallales bacterium]
MMRASAFLCLGFGLICSAADLSILVKTNSADGLGKGWGYPGLVRTVTLATAPADTTDGDGAIRIAATTLVRKGSHYTSFWLDLAQPVDLREKRVLFDAKSSCPATKALYVRFYNEGEKEPAWSFHSWNGQLKAEWRTFALQEALCMDGLAWEAKVVAERKASKIARIEFIIGTRDTEVEMDGFVDNLRVGPRLGTLADLDTFKTILPTTPLVVDGKPVAIVLHPATDAGAAAAQAVVAAVRERTGVALAARSATVADREFAQPAILLGDVFSNPAMLLLYARRLTPVDAVCPGPGGALLHTVYDPFGKGANALVLGAGDDAGLAQAASEFAKLVAAQAKGASLAMPRVFSQFYSAEFLKRHPYADDAENPKRLAQGLATGQRTLDRGKHCSIAADLASVAQRYQFTGHAVEAKLYVALWDLYAKSAVSDPRKFGGAWGFDSDFRSKEVVPGWDLIEEDPSLTDEERLRTVKHLGRWLAEAVVSSCAGAANSSHVPHNHQTFPALGTLYAGLYFSQGYELSEGPFWLGVADAIFQRQATYFKPYEDCNGYQWLTNGHLFSYALSRPDFTVFENGNGRKIIDFLIGNMDNLAIQVPYGDTGSWQCWTSELICLEAYAFATGDPDAGWAANLKRQTRSIRPGPLKFARLADDAPAPTRFNGVKVWPLEPAFYETHGASERPPLAACFDKISFRESVDPEAAYMLLDGLGNGGHKHYDANSIPRITQYDRIWLADNDYYKSPIKFHNSLMVFKDGQSSAMPPYTELLGSGETPRYGYSSTRVSDYSGVDWERVIIWLKPTQSFVVLDRLTAREADEYQFRLLWHGVGEAALDAGGLALTQKGPGMRIQLAPGPELSLLNDTELGANWRGYPHADPVVRSMTGIATVRLGEGESYLFATVLHGAPDGPPPAWDLRFPAGTDGLLLSSPEGSLAIGLGPARIPVEGGLFVTDAQVLVADGGLSLLGATQATHEGDILHQSAEPACVELDNADTNNAMDELTARAPTPNLKSGGDAPNLTPLWQVAPQPKEILLTGNSGTVGALATKPKLAVDPEPAKENVFSAKGANRIAALLDGTWAATDSSVMFEPDQKVTLTVRFEGAVEVNRVAWKQWWAATSSKKTAYKLQNAEVFLSSDDFQQDRRAFGSLRDPGPHPDWGDPLDYALTGKGSGTSIRLELTPQPGTAIYLAELHVFGEGKGKLSAASYDVSRLGLAQLGPDQQAILVGTRQGDVLCLDPETGAVLRSKRFAGAVNDLTAADLDLDGSDEIIVGRRDYWLTVLGSDLAERWSRELKYYRKPPAVNVVRTGDLDGDGKPEVICGGDNWRFYAFSGTGDELWNYESVHPSRSGAVADLDGDGKAEVICGTHYYWASVLNGEGLQQWRARFGPICRDVAVGSFDGNKTRGVVFGAGDGCLHYYDHKGTLRLKYNTGDEVVTVAAADLDGDGIDEFAGGSLNHNVYAFNAKGERLWRADLGAPLVRLLPLVSDTGPRLVAATHSGGVVVLDPAGRIVGRSDLGVAVVDLLVLGADIVAAGADGRLHRLQLPREN